MKRTRAPGLSQGTQRKKGLRAIAHRLRQQTLAAPQAAFQEGRLRQPALAGHPSVQSVLEALADGRDETYPERDALTRALLAEYQARGNSLWASLLVVAYYPMLSRLRLRLNGNPFPGDELDQVVLSTFLTTAAEFPLAECTDRVAMHLRQDTQRQVFCHLQRERRLLPREMPEDSDDDFPKRRPPPNQPMATPTEECMVDLSLLLRRAASAGYSRRNLDVVSVTVLKREQLRSYVGRIAPGDELEHRRLYQRLKRQRTRTLRQLRTLVELSPLARAEGL